MGGDIYLDPEYDSGVPGHRGTRFVVDLKMAPLVAPSSLAHPDFAMLDKGSCVGDDEHSNPTYELPENLNV
jgi:hypothetical protein